MKSLMGKTHDDRKAVRNAEQMILGKKFKAVLGKSLAPRRSRARKNVSESEEDDDTILETEDIFIDDCI